MPSITDLFPGLLPGHLAERARLIEPNPGVRPSVWPGTRCGSAAPRYVLYWTHSACRAHENPALDVALHIANHRGLPVLVIQALPECYPFASDRHHTFMLQAARDLSCQYAKMGVRYALHVSRNGHRGQYLHRLAEAAFCVVTDDMPTAPYAGWVRRLAITVTPPVIAVDTMCVVPPLVVGRSFDRAFEYRNATRVARESRLNFQWPKVMPTEPLLQTELPFEAVDPSRFDLPDTACESFQMEELISQCDIDHTVPRVHDTPGGSKAGYKRWENFAASGGLARYAQQRSDPLTGASSRMSAYLHHGHVSPMRLAREAAAYARENPVHAQSVDKYLDELLVWRELAYNFCHHQQTHDTTAGVPDWAIKSLSHHANDPRPALYTWEELARAKTDDALWNAAQTSLLVHGELHNNLRMTWGKAILNWTSSPQEALRLLIDLNHRYALDGSDPASYAGILWCLGQFDRPFEPERKIIGQVRPRPLSEHARRLDVTQYTARVNRSSHPRPARVAIIGAGISGLVAGRVLQDHRFDVTLFDKGRSVGGRSSTRRVEAMAFDHGAQYFTARDPRFTAYVDAWLARGVIAPWLGRVVSLKNAAIEADKAGVTRYVGVPGMSAIPRHLAQGLNVKVDTRVTRVQKLSGGQWQLTDESNADLGEFDVLITAMPAHQASQLLVDHPSIARRAGAVRMSGCWALLAGFDGSLGLGFDGAFVQESLISWVSNNSSKPGRVTPAPVAALAAGPVKRGSGDDLAPSLFLPSGEPAVTSSESWVVHGSAEWSEANLELTPDSVTPLLWRAFEEAVGRQLPAPAYMSAHRWRFALPHEALPESCLWDRSLRLGASGDWCSGPRIEGAFLSGMAIAGRVLGEV